MQRKFHIGNATGKEILRPTGVSTNELPEIADTKLSEQKKVGKTKSIIVPFEARHIATTL